MKKWLLLAVIGLLAACSQSGIEELNTPTDGDAPIFYASVEGADAESRTYLDETGKMRWTHDDRITIFFGENYNREFAFVGATGTTAGSFEQISTDGFYTAEKMAANYAIYPHAAKTILEAEGYFECTLPATQNYAEGSFGLNANTMVSVTQSVDDRFLQFKNVGGFLKLNLYGANVTVKQITLQGNNNEPLAGAAIITPTYGGEPTLTWAASGTTQVLTLDCGAGVKIGQTEEEATAFYLVVPPTTFEKGFTITLTDTADNNFTKSTPNKQIITRNVTKNMPAFELVTTTVDPTAPVPSNQIWYTSHDGTKIETTAFDATITSHNYVDGMGVITFASDVTQVKADAYKSKTKLATISLPASVTTLGSNAFRDCTRMTTISAPGVTSVGEYAFYNCVKLTDIPFPKLQTIDYNAFQKCVGLTQLDLRSVTRIYSYAFDGCTKLTSVALAKLKGSLGNYAFQNCTALKTIDLPEGVTTIGKGAFEYCTSLASITLPEGLTWIGEDAFYGCTSLKQVYITDITAWCRISFSNYNSNPMQYGADLYLNNVKVEHLVIPEGVTEIEAYAFLNCTSLASITIPEGVTTIAYSAFEKCTSLASITLPESLTTIGDDAFENCTSLASITLPESLTTIEQRAFYDCRSLASITLPEGVTTIGGNAFSGCESLASITIPEGVTSIEYGTFDGCTSLASITIPEGVTTIGEQAFWECTSLASITIPEGVTTIGSSTFYGCTSLKQVYITDITAWCRISFSNYNSNPMQYGADLYLNNVKVEHLVIPEGVTEIEAYAFSGCESLASITIPEGVTTIGDYAFWACTSLASITIPEGVTSIEYGTFDGCTSLTSITIPEGVTTIGSYAFQGCTSLASITLPEGVTTIGGDAFSGCESLASITIPEGVTTIGSEAFYGCTSLKSVYCKPTTPPSGGYRMFYNNATGRKIYVPASDDDSIINAYKAASYWSNYASSIVEYQF